MKRLALIIGCLFGASVSHALYSGYQYQRVLTLDHTKVSTMSATYANFPILISTTGVTLSTSVSGGHLSNANGYDLIYSTNSDCSYKIFWDTETVNTTGSATRNEWVQVPSISSNTDTLIYLCYGNSAITSYQGVSTNTWDSNFKGVWHLSNGTTLSGADSTVNANNGTLTNTPTATTAIIDGGAVYISTNSQSISIADNATLKPSSVTWSMWFKRDGNQANTQHRLIEKGTSALGQPFGSYFAQFCGGDASCIQFLIGVSGTAAGWTSPTGTFTDLTWYNVALTYDKVNIRSYVNGVLKNTTSASGSISYDTNPLSFGAVSDNVGGFGNYFNGSEDEIRLSSGIRTDGWIQTEYNTVNSSATFITFGAETQTASSSAPNNCGLAIQGGRFTILGGKLTIL